MPADISATAPALVSVICRTMGRSVLKEALASLQSQDYPNIELVLVDAAAAGISVDDLELPDHLTLTLVNLDKPLARPAAANAGLDAATGDLLMFLDEDDWIDPGHISGLVNCLQTNSAEAAYSNTRKTDSHGEPLDYVFNEPFRRLLLLRDNYIPIHAMLFSSQLLAQGCRFDEQFDIYEDWDFWLQLAQHTDFAHLDEITAYYREGGDSETATDQADQRYQVDNVLSKARARLFDKWLPKFDGQTLNALIGDMDRSDELRELSATVHSEHEANLGHQNQIRELSAELEESVHQRNLAQQQLAELRNTHVQLQDAHTELHRKHAELHEQVRELLSERKDLLGQQKTLRATTERLNSDLEASRATTERLNSDLEASRAQRAELERNIQGIYQSTSWKLTRPLRSLVRLIRREQSDNK